MGTRWGKAEVRSMQVPLNTCPVSWLSLKNIFKTLPPSTGFVVLGFLKLWLNWNYYYFDAERIKKGKGKKSKPYLD